MNSERKSNKILVFFLIALGLLASFGFGFYVGENSVECPVCKPEDVDFSLFWEAFGSIKENYVDPGKIDVQKVIYGAISGMVDSLEDPYTVFLTPENGKKFIEDASGRFEGIGIEIGIKDSVLQVISPLVGTPAQKAGLMAGDKIIKIDGVSTDGIAVDQAVNLIRGQRGTKVVLTMTRDDWSENKDIEITRGVIEIPSVEWELLNGKVAHIKLYQFSEKTNFDFQRIATEIINSEADSIILDLRNNPGGYLEVAESISGWFLERGDVVVIEDFGSKKEKVPHTANGNSRLSNYPVVVLLNGGSASASEILAGALRDNNHSKIIGEKSFGKGSIQELDRLRGGSILKITIAKWLTPNGSVIDKNGLVPDVEVLDFDSQLPKALEEIQEIS